MRIYRAKDYDEMSRKAANIIAAQMTLKPDSVLGLATGSTPIGTYRELIARYSQGDIDFSRIKTANLDEYRGLPRENDQSYYYFMYENLFRHVNIDMANTNIPNGMEPDSDAECARYEKAVSYTHLDVYKRQLLILVEHAQGMPGIVLLRELLRSF